MKKKRFIWAKKYKDWTSKQWRQVLFSDESHFLIHRVRNQHVRITKGEPLKESHIDQAVKHPQSKCFGVVSAIMGLDHSSQLKA